MKLKRIFAFLIMVFVLSGCVNDVSYKGTIQSIDGGRVSFNGRQFIHKKGMQEAMASVPKKTSLQSEVKDYVISKKSKSSFLQQEEVKNVFATIQEKSKVAQYEKEEVKEEAEPALAEFTVRTTLYGMDCKGCYIRSDGTAGTATGVRLHPTKGVLQSDGTWLEGITYDGYYIIAADGSLPFYSIIELTNHGISGMGISPDQPIKCIVLDRGGAIKGNKIDFYIGTEQNYYDRLIVNRGSNVKAKVLRYGR